MSTLKKLQQSVESTQETKKFRTPKYRRKGKYGIITLSDPSGQRKDFLLGMYGTKEVRAEAAGRRLKPPAVAGCSVAASQLGRILHDKRGSRW